MHCTILAADLARVRAGSSIAARMAIIAMTTSSSMSVNAERPLYDATIRMWEPAKSLNSNEGGSQAICERFHFQIVRGSRIGYSNWRLSRLARNGTEIF